MNVSLEWHESLRQGRAYSVTLPPDFGHRQGNRIMPFPSGDFFVTPKRPNHSTRPMAAAVYSQPPKWAVKLWALAEYHSWGPLAGFGWHCTQVQKRILLIKIDFNPLCIPFHKAGAFSKWGDCPFQITLPPHWPTFKCYMMAHSIYFMRHFSATSIDFIRFLKIIRFSLHTS